MTLKNRISEDMKATMRAKDAPKLEAIRLLRAAIQRREVDGRSPLDDEGVVSVIQKQLKQCEDAITQFHNGGRDDLVAKERVYQDVLKAYLPQQLEEQEVDRIIAAAVAQTGATTLRDMGKVMTILKSELQGRVDMSGVSRKVKAQLED